MRGLIAGIITSVILFVFFSVAKKKAAKIEKEMDSNNFTVRQPKSSFIIYIICTIFFSFIFVVGVLPSVGVLPYDAPSNYRDFNLAGMLSFFPFLLLGPFFIVLWIRFKISVNDDQLTVRTYFKRKKTFTLDYITMVKQGRRKTNAGNVEYITAFHEKEKLFSITPICPGYNVLNSYLKNKGVNYVFV